MARVIVIGGGAAGFFGAITCAEHGVGEVLILEQSARLLGKVRISGGGRCNLTHACFEPAAMVDHYPRGRKSLIGPFHRWQSADTVEWFEERGVALKTEQDGRMFPVTDDSQTVIDCLTTAARGLGVTWETSCRVLKVGLRNGGFRIETNRLGALQAEFILIATGGIRSRAARRPAEGLGHPLAPPVPSLFTFHIEDSRLDGLAGISVPNVRVEAAGLIAEGPLLITHWGLSGPAILKLSALGARELAARDYEFRLQVDWTNGVGEEALRARFQELRRDHGGRRVVNRSPVGALPKRLWERLCHAVAVPEQALWSNLTRECERQLLAALTASAFDVRGKSLNKDEFVTCGGVELPDVNLRTMESKLVPGVYFAGEVLDIDGITGGFNFQAAWTTGRLAGEAIAVAARERDGD